MTYWKTVERLSLAAVVLAFLAAGCSNTNSAAPGNGNGSAPDGGSEPSISVSPRRGSAGTGVQVHAEGFPANATVEIGFGPPQSEYEVITMAQTDVRGQLSTTVEVPSWAEGGRPYVFVVADTDNRPKAVSDPFTVTASGER